MKRCPQCNRLETDDALSFCRADGTPLASESANFDGALTEVETSLLPQSTNANANRVTGPTTVLRAIAVVLAASVSIAGYFFLRKKPNSAIQSIAVMPFVNAGSNPDVEYLSDGMTETLINTLSQLPDLSVKARSSVFRYKGKEVEPHTVGTIRN